MNEPPILKLNERETERKLFPPRKNGSTRQTATTLVGAGSGLCESFVPLVVHFSDLLLDYLDMRYAFSCGTGACCRQ